MTWTKLSDDYGADCAPLSDAAFRTHTEALLWVMQREVGSRFPKRELRRFAETDDPDAAAAELVRLGYWIDHGDAFEVVHQYAHQVEPEVIAKRREMDAERQRKARLKKAGLPSGDPASASPSRRDNTRDVQGDNTRDSGLVWTGLDGSGNYAPTEEVTHAREDSSINAVTGEVVADDWPAAWSEPRPSSAASQRPSLCECGAELTSSLQRERGTCNRCYTNRAAERAA